MKFKFNKNFLLFVTVLFNSYSFITNQISSCQSEDCVIIYLYYNGTMKSECVNDTSNINKIGSIGSYNKIILYDCKNYNDTGCQIKRNEDEFNKTNCMDKKAQNSNSFCANLKEYHKENEAEENYTETNYCVDIDINEYERFKKINYSVDNLKKNNQNFGILQCYDKFYKLDLYNYIIILILFSLINF